MREYVIFVFPFELTSLCMTVSILMLFFLVRDSSDGRPAGTGLFVLWQLNKGPGAPEKPVQC